MNVEDHRYMAQAIQLARKGLYTTDPNPRVGCLIVKNDQIVGQGWHQLAGGPHAEIVALNQAGSQSHGATVYVSLEPCCHTGKTGPCTQALVDAKVKRVVVAMLDPNPNVAGKGIAQLKQAGIEIDRGIMAVQAETLNPGFIKRMTHAIPWLRLKMAMTLDGKTSIPGQKWISSDCSRTDVQHWRARSSAILTGIGTVLKDDPSLDCRLPEQVKQPIRVVLDSQARLPSQPKLFHRQSPILWLTGKPLDRDLPSHVQHIQAPLVENKIDLHWLVDQLGKFEINEVMTECGSTLAGALLSSGYVDELVIYMAKSIAGEIGNSLFQLNHPNQSIHFKFKDIRMFGEDIRLLLEPERS